MARDAIEWKIEGFDELVKELRDLPDNVKVNGIRKVLKNSAIQVRDRAKALVRTDTGKLQSLIQEKRPRTKSKNFFKHTIGVPKGEAIKGQKNSGRKDPKGAFYAPFIEFGTSRIPEKSYLRQALEEKTPGTVGGIVDNVRTEVNKSAARHNKRIAKRKAQ